MKKIVLAVLGIISVGGAWGRCTQINCNDPVKCLLIETGELSTKDELDPGYYCSGVGVDENKPWRCMNGDYVHVYGNGEYLKAYMCASSTWRKDLSVAAQERTPAARIDLVWQDDSEDEEDETPKETAPVADVCVKCGLTNRQGNELVGCNPNNPSVFNNEGVLYRKLSGGDASYANSIKSAYPGYVVDMAYCVNKEKTVEKVADEGSEIEQKKDVPDAEQKEDVKETITTVITPAAPAGPSKAKEAWGELAKIEFENDGWQSKDGKGFNWTRFGIDAAGAAVLATGAGILTNTLIKKSQLKGGYRNIQCVSGGQTVGFGEVFIVR